MYNEAIELIKSAIGKDDADERRADVERAIKDIERAVATTKKDNEDEITRINGESKGYRLKKKENASIISERDEKILEMQEVIDELKQDNSLETITQERDDLKIYKESNLKRVRQDFINDHKSLKDHKDYDKLKDRLVLPESDNGEMDFEKISDEDIEKNQVSIQDARSYGLFGNIKSDKTFHSEAVLKSGEDEGYFQDEDFN